MQTAPVIEIFTSIQGEGILVGNRQIFLRLAGCNLDCVYCDTDVSAPEYAEIYQQGNNRQPTRLTNPLSSDKVAQIIHQINNQEKQKLTVAVTGGEPLTQSKLLSELLPLLKAEGHKILLETNGILPRNLTEIIDHLDYISMDLKLPSQLKGADYFKEQKEFLNLAIKVPGLYLKIVVASETTREELYGAIEVTDKLVSLPPLILQPITRQGKVAIDEKKICCWQSELLSRFPQVLVIPQTQVFLGLK